MNIFSTELPGVIKPVSNNNKAPNFFTVRRFSLIDIVFFQKVSYYMRRNAVVAQLVRALPCHGRGREFESRPPRIMRIRPVVVTGAATLVAMSTIGIVVSSTVPSTAGVAVLRLLWVAAFLFMWGLLCTALLLARRSIVQSTWVALVLTMLAVGGLVLFRHGIL